MEYGEDMEFEELSELEQDNLEITNQDLEVEGGSCECGGKLTKKVENKILLDGSITFHITKLKCQRCGKEYLDLNQAEKYDFLLMLERAIKHPLNKISIRTF